MDKIIIFIQNLIYWFKALFVSEQEPIVQIIDVLSKAVAEGKIISIIPEEMNMFFERFGYSFSVIISSSYLKTFFEMIGSNLRLLTLVLMMLMIISPLLYLLITSYFKIEKPFFINKESKAVILWNKFYDKIILPFRFFIELQLWILTQRKYFKWIAIISLVLYLNIPNLVIDFLSYYIYYSANVMDLTLIWDLFVALIIDLSPVLISIPIPVYVIIGYLILVMYRNRLADDILRHHDAINCGVVKGSGILIMINGAPGAGKTKLQTDMAITCEMLFRQMAKGIMDEIFALFPNFRWDIIRKKIDLEIKLGKFKNPSDGERFVDEKIKPLFFYSINNDTCFLHYDYKKYGLYFENGLVREFLIDDIVDYAKAYFVYQSNHALLSSNYPIRVDHNEIGNGHLVEWNYDFFIKECSDLLPQEYSKIVNFDTLRLAKKKDTKSDDGNIPIAYVYALTELGKERGNTLENAEVKKNVNEANVKNDGFTDMLRVGRHPLTIRNRCFFKVLFDEQRASSCGIALSGITEDILTIDKKKTISKSSMFFNFIEKTIMEFFASLSAKFFRNYETKRNDKTVLSIFFAWLSRFSSRYLLKLNNRYGYDVISFYHQNGTLPEDHQSTKIVKYYLAYRKIYANRYASDYLRSFFDLRTLLSGKSFASLKSYHDIYPSWKNMISQNSYMVDKLASNLGYQKS